MVPRSCDSIARSPSPRSKGLDVLAGLNDVLRNNHRVAAVRAVLAQRVGDIELAQASYRKAIDLCSNDVETAHLTARLEAISAGERP